MHADARVVGRVRCEFCDACASRRTDVGFG
jgi:hypothetical protein